MVRALIFLIIAVLVHAQAPTSSLSLTVIDSVTRFPIEGASVNLRINGGNPLPTNAAGGVEFSGLTPTPGSYSLSVSAEGYSFNDFPYRGAITLQAGKHLKLGLVPLDPLGSLSGTVLDDDGKPVSGGRVEAMLVDVPPTGPLVFGADIDSDGTYKIADLRRGRYVVGMAANPRLGVPVSYYPSGDNFDQAIRVDVHAGRETEHIDLRVRRTQVYHVRGVVEGVLGTDEAYISVRSCESSGVRDFFLRYPTEPVRPDRGLDMEVFPGDYCFDLQTFAPSGGSSFARTRVRITNRDVEDIRMLAVPPKELIGMVKIEKGADLEMPGRVALANINAYVPTAQVQSDGSFRLTGVFPVDYRLQIPTRGSYVKSVKLGGMELGDGHVNMESGGGPLLIEIAAARGRGRVKVNFGSAKPAQVPVVLRPTGSAAWLVQIGYANDQGELTLERLAPGIYNVYAFEDEYTLMTEPDYLDRFQATSVRIVDKEEVSIEIPLITHKESEQVKASF